VSIIKKTDLQKYFQHLIQRGRQGLGIEVDDKDVILTYIYDITNKLDALNKQIYGETSFFNDSEEFKSLLYRDFLLTATQSILKSPHHPYSDEFEQTAEKEQSLEKLTSLAYAEMDKSSEFTFLFWKGVILGYKLKCEEFLINPDIAHTAVLSMELDPEDFKIAS